MWGTINLGNWVLPSILHFQFFWKSKTILKRKFYLKCVLKGFTKTFQNIKQLPPFPALVRFLTMNLWWKLPYIFIIYWYNHSIFLFSVTWKSSVYISLEPHGYLSSVGTVIHVIVTQGTQVKEYLSSGCHWTLDVPGHCENRKT